MGGTADSVLMVYVPVHAAYGIKWVGEGLLQDIDVLGHTSGEGVVASVRMGVGALGADLGWASLVREGVYGHKPLGGLKSWFR